MAVAEDPSANVPPAAVEARAVDPQSSGGLLIILIFQAKHSQFCQYAEQPGSGEELMHSVSPRCFCTNDTEELMMPGKVQKKPPNKQTTKKYEPFPMDSLEMKAEMSQNICRTRGLGYV